MSTRHFIRRALGIAARAGALVAGLGGAAPMAAAPSPLPPPAVLGTVTDTGGRPLPNVTVHVTALRRVTSTDDRGRFVLRGLPPGHHHLDAVLIGFARAEAEVDVPENGADVTVAIRMEPTIVRLSDVVVSAAPTGGDALGITQSTVDVSGKELSATMSASIAQTLETQPGLATRYNGPAATLPVIRGLTGERILVLQNGERSGDLSSAAPDHGLTIDPLSADRIEVVRGPASLLYGTAALGGVVNVISSDIPNSVPDRVAGFLAGQGESVRPGGAGSGSLTLPLGGAAALTFTGGARSASDVLEGGGSRLLNSQARDNHQTIGLGLIGDRGSLGVAVRRYDFTYGLPGEAGDPELGGTIAGHRNELELRADIPGGSGLLRSLSVSGTVQAYKHDEIENTGDVGTSFDLRTQTANATLKTAFGRVEGAVGLSALFKQYAATGAEALTPAADTKSPGVFVFEEIPLAGNLHDGAKLQLGARYDAFNIDSRTGDPKFGTGRSVSFDNYSGSLGVTVPVRAGASLAVNAARAFRAPTVEELFSNAFHAALGTFDVGNPDLKAETNSGLEAVFRIESPRVNGQFSAYYNAISDYIVPGLTGDTLVGGAMVPLNHFTQQDAALRGAEAMIEGQVASRVVVGGLFDFTRGSFKGGSNVPFMPAMRLGAHARWDNGVLSFGADVRHGFAQDKVSSGIIDVATEAYTLVNLTAGLNLLRGGLVHSVTFRVDNATDERYRDATSWIKNFAYNPGRNVAVVYKVLF